MWRVELTETAADASGGKTIDAVEQTGIWPHQGTQASIVAGSTMPSEIVPAARRHHPEMITSCRGRFRKHDEGLRLSSAIWAVDELGFTIPQATATNAAEETGAQMHSHPVEDRDAQIAAGVSIEEDHRWELGFSMASYPEEERRAEAPVGEDSASINMDAELTLGLSMEEGTAGAYGGSMYIPPDMDVWWPSGAMMHEEDDVPMAGPSRFPGALSYPVGRVGGSATSFTTQLLREDGAPVSTAIAPGLLYAEQGAITTEYAVSLDEDENEEDLDTCDDGADDNEDDTSILYTNEEDNTPLASNEDESAILDDDVNIEAAADLSLVAPPITRSHGRSACGNSTLMMPGASRGKKRRADEDGEDDEDDEKAVKKARKGKAKDTGQKKQKTKPKAKRTAKAKGKAKASSTKNKAKAGNTKSEEKRFPCLQAGCDQTFGRQSESSRHFRCSCPKRDPDDLEKPPCPHCKAPLCRGDSVRRHIEEGACPALKQSPGESKESGASSDGNYGKRKGGDKGGRGGGKHGRGGGKDGRGGGRGGRA
ncbi:predicted protein [Postia placenta Mad-698-R]|uniref:C2H2-type domain-containing protein n=1 Tax=Postia placenta MAD-698-R-SB12 TaxID=670580 RepID=A0A1X6MXM6_9APHY|nr:hypothetical protein POSPLADRAFT_1145812 [Postia placenta MAD-698-R-SB12]EED85704.1 predicted protein [Postia placenta Mad-698-R]OSX60973.1 hypothetical protein POSPLADRAFT_1145812 [Postia placenta MAD-698-R-SB12]